MTDARTAEEPGRVKPRAVALCALAGLVTWLIPWGLSEQAHETLAILVGVGGLWVTEAMPLGATALLVPVFGIARGVSTPKEAFAGFGEPIVFLFLGTFVLTDAASRCGLDRRLADQVMSSEWVQRSPRRILFAIAFLGCAISAWINNTATTAMLLPLAMTAARLNSPRFLTSVLLMTAYAPSLGGLATPVGTAPNLIGLAQIERFLGPDHRPSFVAWLAAFAPLAMIATLGSAAWLAWRGGRPKAPEALEMTHEIVPVTSGQKTLMAIFAIVISLWVAPGIVKATPLGVEPWVKTWESRLPEACVPLLGALALFVIPSGRGDGSRLTDHTVLRRIDWSTILLFGGGMSLGGMLEKSGLARSMGEGLFHAMPIEGAFGITLAATLMAVIVSEMTSNTASATLVVPIVLALAKAAGVDPLGPALAATVGCSFGFMLPVSTPPNALVYGTGRLTIRDMVRCGLLLDIAGALLVAGWVTLVVRWT